MFASAWQLLTAIFFLSALTKLIYKLIKEVDRRPTSSQQLQQQQHLVAPIFQQQPVEPEVEAEGHLEFAVDYQQQRQFAAQLRHRPSSSSSLTQASWSSPGSPSSSASLSSSSTWNSLNSARLRQQQLQLEQQQLQRDQDSDDEELVFEEALTFVLSQATGGPTRSQLDEERRLQEARWLTRQLFRRQLNRLASSSESASEPQLEHLGEQLEPEVEVELDANGQLGLVTQRQQEAISALEAEDGDEKRVETTTTTTTTTEQNNESFAWSINFDEVQSLSGSGRDSDKSSSSSGGRSSGASPNRKWSTLNLSYLVAEVFLLEPVKLTLNILSGTFAVFCGFLDFIEGIEHSPADEELEQPSATSGRRPGAQQSRTSTRLRPATSLPAGSQSGQPKRAATAARQQVTPRATGSQLPVEAQSIQRQQQRQEPPAGEQRRSNYFHRRYFSRRSLSAALLSDDQHQVAA